MKKTAQLAFAVIALLPMTAKAASLEIKCDSPDLNYIYRFSMDQTLPTYTDSENPGSYGVYYKTLKIQARKAGTESKVEEIELKGLRGTLTKVENSFTKKPYYNLKLQSKDKKTFAQLNLDYPSKLSSFIKTEEGFKYKATCKLVSFKGCAFGDSIFEANENPNISKEELGTELKIIPGFNEDSTPVNTKKVQMTLKSGQSYTAWYTYQDEVDGGNTYGTIEDASGNQVAEIADSDIYGCTVIEDLK